MDGMKWIDATQGTGYKPRAASTGAVTFTGVSTLTGVLAWSILGLCLGCSHIRNPRRDLESFRLRCFQYADDKSLRPSTLASGLQSIVEEEWITHPDAATELSFIDLVTDLRSHADQTRETHTVVRAIMGVLYWYGERPSLDYFQRVFDQEGLASLVDITVGLGDAAAYYANMGPDEQRSDYEELTRFIHENIACREELIALLKRHSPKGLVIADPLSKRLVCLDSKAATQFLRSISETRFCGVGGVRSVSATFPEAPPSIANSLPPRGAFTSCPFGQIQGERPLVFWFSYPEEDSDTATCFDRVVLPLANGPGVRVMPVAPSVKKMLNQNGLAGRKIADLAWWLSLGSRSVWTVIGGKEVLLLPWEEISKPIVDVLPWDRSYRVKEETLDYGPDP